MRSISLFTGAMGLDIGIEKAGFSTAVCVENDSVAVETIKLNKPEIPVIDNSIVDTTGEQLRELGDLGQEIDLVTGGPPCQSFSVFGNREGINDSRGQMIFEFVRIVSELRPHVFIMENVRGLLSTPVIPPKMLEKIDGATAAQAEKGSLIRELFQRFNKIGYRVDCFVVNSVNYGAPQVRERLIIIGNRHNFLADFPAPQYSNRPEDELPPFVTLGEAIGNEFEDPCPEVMDFSPRKLKYLAMIPPGGNWRSLPVDIQKESMGKSWYLKGGRSAYWRKLSFDFPSPTVVTMPNHAGTSMCHPTELRAITIGEAAAIQEFPHSWQFTGSTTDKFRQVGNAVPTRLGYLAGLEAKKLLEKINRGEKGNAPEGESHRIIHLRPHVRTRTFWKNGKAYSGETSYYEKTESNSAPSSGQLHFEFVT